MLFEQRVMKIAIWSPKSALGKPKRRCRIVTQNSGAQGINAGDFDAVVRAIRNNAAYANVHTQTFTPGEIRGHIEEHERHSHGDRR